MSGIKDKVVVITGASSGIGEATALLLAERGAKVVLGARGPDRLEALAARIAASGGEAAYARTETQWIESVHRTSKGGTDEDRELGHPCSGRYSDARRESLFPWALPTLRL